MNNEGAAKVKGFGCRPIETYRPVLWLATKVKGFGCRPIETYPPVLWPASESPPGRNPRGLGEQSAVYGDYMSGGIVKADLWALFNL
jgi:hypothetical protein